MHILKTPVITDRIGITGDEIYLYLLVSTIKRKNGDDNKGITATDRPTNHQPTTSNQPPHPVQAYTENCLRELEAT